MKGIIGQSGKLTSVRNVGDVLPFPRTLGNTFVWSGLTWVRSGILAQNPPLGELLAPYKVPYTILSKSGPGTYGFKTSNYNPTVIYSGTYYVSALKSTGAVIRGSTIKNMSDVGAGISVLGNITSHKGSLYCIAGSPPYLYKSTDNGGTWVKGVALSTTALGDLVSDDTNMYYMSFTPSTYTYYYSSDGTTWTTGMTGNWQSGTAGTMKLMTVGSSTGKIVVCTYEYTLGGNKSNCMKLYTTTAASWRISSQGWDGNGILTVGGYSGSSSLLVGLLYNSTLGYIQFVDTPAGVYVAVDNLPSNAFSLVTSERFVSCGMDALEIFFTTTSGSVWSFDYNGSKTWRKLTGTFSDNNAAVVNVNNIIYFAPGSNTNELGTLDRTTPTYGLPELATTANGTLVYYLAVDKS